MPRIMSTINKLPSAPLEAARTNATPPGWGKARAVEIPRGDTPAAVCDLPQQEGGGRPVGGDRRSLRPRLEVMAKSASEIEAMLFLRCHAAFRAAAGEAMAGQVVESYRQCRGMMECAAYAVHIRRDPSLAKVWLDRHVDEAGMKASKKAFRHELVVASVTAANMHAGRRFEELYQRTIDFGGHPNERSVTGSMKLIEGPERRVMLAIMLHGDDAALDMGLKSVAQCAMVSLEMLQVLYDAKFEILGINAAMLSFRKGL